jgi:hypothetical protein
MRCPNFWKQKPLSAKDSQRSRRTAKSELGHYPESCCFDGVIFVLLDC